MAAGVGAAVPAVVPDRPTGVLEDSPDPESFRRAMCLFHVGDTIKITGADRHVPADALLWEHVDLRGALVVDIGVSDGTTAVELAAGLPADASYVMADLYLALDVVHVGRSVLFYEPTGRCVLIASRRLMAWPALSRTVRALWAPLLLAGRRRERRSVMLLGPQARELLARDPRVSVRVHDVFEPWAGVAPDVVKVANVLRRLYFSDDRITRALAALHAGMADGGHLLLVDNPRIAGVPVRGGLYRRVGGRFVAVARTEHAPEIDDLVTRLDVLAGQEPHPAPVAAEA